MRNSWTLLLSALVGLAALSGSTSAATLPLEARNELKTLNAIQRRDFLNGLLVAKAVDERMRSEGKGPLSEEQARAIWEFEVTEGSKRRRSNPSGTYAPTVVSNCPAAPSNEPGGMTGYIRNGSSQEINSQEADYISRHRTSRQDDWATWLGSASPGPNLQITGGTSNYTKTVSNLPKVGIAASGGGLRAMLYSAGIAQGLDGRNATANERGTGGVLQLADYFAGLSGGSWITGAFAINNWPTAQSLNDNVFDLESNVVIPSDGKIGFYTDLIGDVADKRSNFPTSITDYWGRALSYKLLNDSMYPDQGQATTWSDIVNTTAFESASMPFPIVIADEREPGQLLIGDSTTILEFNPYEFGTWNRIQGFIPIRILGSTIQNGVVTSCVEGYDNFGWVVGTSASLFNAAFTTLLQSDGDSIITDAITAALGAIDSEDNDVSQVPNPFANWTNGQDSVNQTASTLLTLVDGGLDNNNVPLEPLLQPARNLDFILALDASADTDAYWPNGSSLWHTHLRATNNQDLFKDVPVPYFPNPNTFVNRGLNTRPVFFGCNASNATNAATAANNVLAPIVAYIPNYPYMAQTNFSTYKLDYAANESQAMLDNGVQIATLGGNNATWAQCLACGMLQRSFERSGTTRPSECEICMNTYCWDGVEDDSTPSQSYTPAIGTPPWVLDDSTQSAPPSTGSVASSSDDTSSSAAVSQSSHRAFVAGMVSIIAIVALSFIA